MHVEPRFTGIRRHTLVSALVEFVRSTKQSTTKASSILGIALRKGTMDRVVSDTVLTTAGTRQSSSVQAAIVEIASCTTLMAGSAGCRGAMPARPALLAPIARGAGPEEDSVATSSLARSNSHALLPAKASIRSVLTLVSGPAVARTTPATTVSAFIARPQGARATIEVSAVRVQSTIL
jgi:hypothetical protein